MNNTSINDIQDPSIRLNNSNISNIQNSNNSNIPGNENLSLENVKKQLEERRPQLDNLVNAASKEKSDIKLIAGIIAGAAIIASIVLFTLASSVGIALVCEILLILWIAVAVIDTLLILCAGKSHDKEIQEINNEIEKLAQELPIEEEKQKTGNILQGLEDIDKQYQGLFDDEDENEDLFDFLESRKEKSSAINISNNNINNEDNNEKIESELEKLNTQINELYSLIKPEEKQSQDKQDNTENNISNIEENENKKDKRITKGSKLKDIKGIVNDLKLSVKNKINGMNDQKKIEKLNKNLDDFKSTLTTILEQANQNKLHKNKNESLRKEIEELKNLINQKDNKIKQIQNESAEKDKTIEKLNKTLNEEKNNLTEQLNKNKIEIENLNSKINSQDNEINQKENKLNELNNKIKTNKIELSTRDNKISEYEKKIKENLQDAINGIKGTAGEIYNQIKDNKNNQTIIEGLFKGQKNQAIQELNEALTNLQNTDVGKKLGIEYNEINTSNFQTVITNIQNLKEYTPTENDLKDANAISEFNKKLSAISEFNTALSAFSKEIDTQIKLNLENQIKEKDEKLNQNKIEIEKIKNDLTENYEKKIKENLQKDISNINKTAGAIYNQIKDNKNNQAIIDGLFNKKENQAIKALNEALSGLQKTEVGKKLDIKEINVTSYDTFNQLIETLNTKLNKEYKPTTVDPKDADAINKFNTALSAVSNAITTQIQLNLENQIKTKDEKIEKNKIEIEQIKTLNSQNQQNIKELNSKINNKNLEIENLKTLKSDYENLKIENKEIKETNQTLNEKNNLIQTDLNNKILEIKTLNNTIETNKKTIENLNKDKNDLNNKINQINKTLETNKNEYNNKIKELTSNLNTNKSEYEKIKNDLTENYEKKIKDLQNKQLLEKLQRDISDINKTAREIGEQIENREDIIEELFKIQNNQTIQALNKALSGIKDTGIGKKLLDGISQNNQNNKLDFNNFNTLLTNAKNLQADSYKDDPEAINKFNTALSAVSNAITNLIIQKKKDENNDQKLKYDNLNKKIKDLEKDRTEIMEKIFKALGINKEDNAKKLSSEDLYNNISKYIREVVGIVILSREVEFFLKELKSKRKVLDELIKKIEEKYLSKDMNTLDKNRSEENTEADIKNDIEKLSKSIQESCKNFENTIEILNVRKKNIGQDIRDANNQRKVGNMTPRELNPSKSLYQSTFKHKESGFKTYRPKNGKITKNEKVAKKLIKNNEESTVINIDNDKEQTDIDDYIYDNFTETEKIKKLQRNTKIENPKILKNLDFSTLKNKAKTINNGYAKDDSSL